MDEIATPPTLDWATEQGLDLRVNGIFKGGGAKGILYGGALQAVAESGLWFRAVAGSSAGAITATLIAAGLSPQRIVAEVPAGLRGVKVMPLGDLVGSPILRTPRLAVWLEAILRAAARTEGDVAVADVTFAELFAATRIELYVVAVDVADRQPRVFSALTTPDLSVTLAVIASSAIPMAFRPSRLEVESVPGKTRVHRVMDGGVWANYPAFVFREPSFRAFHSLKPVPPDSLTIGFTLDSTGFEESKKAIRFRSDVNFTSRDRGGFLPFLFRNPFLRFYLMTIVPIVIALQFWYTLDAVGLIFIKDWTTRDGVPWWVANAGDYFNGFFGGFSPGPYTAITALLVTALVAAVLGGTILDSGFPAMRTLLAVGTDVPYWVGAHGDDHVVRLTVPAGISTATFKVPPERLVRAVASGHDQALPQLSAILVSDARAREVEG